MRIGIVVGAYDRRGGLERVAVEYARGLRARGHEVTVFAGSFDREPEDDGIAFRRVRAPRRRIAARAALFPIMATRAVERARPDNILAFGSTVTIPAVLRVPGCHRSWWEVANREWPVTTSDGLRRRMNPHHRIILGWDRRVLGRGTPTEVLAAGGWAADDIRRFYPAVADRVSVLADGVNLEEFRRDPGGAGVLRARWEAEGPVLFTVATELRRKGLGTLFEAFRLVRREIPRAVLVVGGHVPAPDVRALAVQHRVEAGVRAIGFVEELPAAYSAADAFVFPTRFDPWGLPVVEALACGTPVAVSTRAGAASAVRPGETGAMIEDPSDHNAVALAMVAALSLRPSPDQVRASVEHLAWSAVVDGLDAVLERTA